MNVGGANVWLGSLAPTAVAVATIRGRESLSGLYRFDIKVRTDVDLLSMDPTLLGASATLFMSTDGDTPVVTRGIVTAISTLGVDAQDKRMYSVRLSPRLAALEWRKNSRIFQDVSVVDIVNRVLDGHGISKNWTLVKKYPVRSYCVQYQETDYAFIKRVCADAGIFFYFAQPNFAELEQSGPTDQALEQVVFCDDVRHYPPLTTPGVHFVPTDAATMLVAPNVPFRSQGALGGTEYVHEFVYRRTVRPQSVSLRDYDFMRPLLDLKASVQTERDEKRTRDKMLDATPAQTWAPLEVYEHHGEYSESDVSPAQANVRLDGYRARAMVAKGKGNCRRFSVGRRFKLDGYPIDELDGREFTIVRVEHSYSSSDEAQAYSNTFECVPASIAYRAKPKTRNLGQVVETAVVVGPAGERIFTDALGRIKVQFHWDRDGLKNEHSSCFMRVAQPWAGASWGVQFIPRIGDEVVVSFIGGDEDRPIVVGSVYNATHPPPFPLPLGKSKSGIRTQSIGGSGSNEVSFEDGAGAELLTLRAARDLRETSGNDHIVEVSNDQTTVVTKSQRVTIGASRSTSIGGDENTAVTGSASRVVSGNESSNVAGYRRETITGSSNSELHGENVHNHGNELRIVEGFLSTTIGTEERPTGSDVLVYGHESHAVSKSLTLQADTRIVIQCGQSSITMSPESLRIDAKKILLKAKEKLVLMGDGPGIELEKDIDILGDTIKLFSQGGSLELDSTAAHVDGPLVKLNCGAGSAPDIHEDDDPPGTKLFKWRCLGANLKPMKGKIYRLAALGTRFKGSTDNDGYVMELIPEDAVMADLTVWLDEYPTGRRMHRSIRLEELPPSTSVLGAQIRLANLGYYTGADTDELTPELANALREFQHDHRIEESAELDAATTDKLDEVHPG